jgi:osmoprotectant transport system ATP-binding protein
VDADGRATGVGSQQTIGEAIRGAHAAGRTDAKVAG